MTELVARQPIFTRRETVYGYELLFRSGLANLFDGKDGEAASRAVADQLITVGQSLTHGRKAFINCTAEFLLREFVTLLPPTNTVVEILETVKPDPEVVSACRKLKRAGYTIALDDFVAQDRLEPFIELADIIKVDFMLAPVSVRKDLIQEFAPRGVRMLAEKVETRQEFDEALAAGYEYFQGHFFSRPEIVPGRRLSVSKLSALQILLAVSHPNPDLYELEQAITYHLPVCYKLLRYVNSPFLGFRSEVKSVRHALALLGQAEVRRLVSLAVALSIANGKPPELINSALLRARSCELLASRLRQQGLQVDSSAAFLVGMFSIMDALLGQPLSEILDQVALPSEAREALRGGAGHLRDVYELVDAYDSANWTAVSLGLNRLHLDESAMPVVYFEALDWVAKILEVQSCVGPGWTSANEQANRYLLV
ncbi:MAG TPA: HDOD domain-containing protein [Terriglobia bacterium]|nr:HDOD domain-containing protein [Terriglobia bacterium]